MNQLTDPADALVGRLHLPGVGAGNHEGAEEDRQGPSGDGIIHAVAGTGDAVAGTGAHVRGWRWRRPGPS